MCTALTCATSPSHHALFFQLLPVSLPVTLGWWTPAPCSFRNTSHLDLGLSGPGVTFTGNSSCFLPCSSQRAPIDPTSHGLWLAQASPRLGHAQDRASSPFCTHSAGPRHGMTWWMSHQMPPEACFPLNWEHKCCPFVSGGSTYFSGTSERTACPSLKPSQCDTPICR